jgi:hypothetical protein
MLTASSTQGLVVSVSPLATPALGEVSGVCGWPVLMHATPLELRREMLRCIPRASLFWLDDERYVGVTAELISWLATWEPAVRRIAIGYQLRANVEVAMRSAGVHLYLAADDDLQSMFELTVAPWLHFRGQPAVAAREQMSKVQSVSRSRASPHNNLHVTGPP